ncbi:hypothetical protein GGF46_002554 [Coemansia sp. RSA 552]|nr:hypothetical protein GGF46_002554 [Coemansia sp. RSA 552]
MVAGLPSSRRARGPSSSGTPSSGWRFPLRADSLPFAKAPPDHHIVHTSIQDGLDKLNDYLRTETQINSGAAAQSEPATPENNKRAIQAATSHSLLSLRSDRDMQRMRLDTTGFGALHSMLLPNPGARSPPHSREPSSDQRRAHEDLLDGLTRAFQETSLHCPQPGPEADVPTHDSRPECAAVSPSAGVQAARLDSRPRQENDGTVAQLTPAPSTRSSSTCPEAIIALYSRIPEIQNDRRSSTGSSSSKPDIEELQHDRTSSPISPEDAELLDAVSALLPETPKTLSSGSSSNSSGSNGSNGSSPRYTRRQDQAGCDLEQSSAVAKDVELRLAERLAELERQFNRSLAAEREKHAMELKQRDEVVAAQLGELADVRVNHDALEDLLEESIQMSEQLAQQNSNEKDGLMRELGSLTLARQRLQAELAESRVRLDTLTSDHCEIQQHASTLVAANTRLESLNKALQDDIGIAEQRTAQIKEHAQATLDKANAEISRLQAAAEMAQQDAKAANAKCAKAEARSKSLNIQLTTTRQQNKELLALCERI